VANSELSLHDIKQNSGETEEETESAEPKAAEPADSVKPKRSTVSKKSDESSDESGESRLERLERQLKAERSKIRKAEERKRLKTANGYYDVIHEILGRPHNDTDVEKLRKFLVAQDQRGNYFSNAMNS
jgi:hypothetical protein